MVVVVVVGGGGAVTSVVRTCAEPHCLYKGNIICLNIVLVSAKNL